MNKDSVNLSDKEIEKGLNAIFESIFISEKKKAEDLYGELVGKLIDKHGDYVKDAEHFDILVNYGIEQVLELYIQRLLGSEINEDNVWKLLFFYKQYSFLENNITKLIVKKEGSPCSADKSRWILRSYREYIISGNLPNMEIGERCYWKPRFGTAQEWMDFCEALELLHYGNPEKYFVSIKALITQKGN